MPWPAGAGLEKNVRNAYIRVRIRSGELKVVAVRKLVLQGLFDYGALGLGGRQLTDAGG